jgi:uncharacterized protein YidB (DUF937 family)
MRFDSLNNDFFFPQELGGLGGFIGSGSLNDELNKVKTSALGKYFQQMKNPGAGAKTFIFHFVKG